MPNAYAVVSTPTPFVVFLPALSQTPRQVMTKTGILTALIVDEELHADRVSKVLSTEGCQLKVDFAACDARMLRVSVNSFFDMTALATKTLDAF